MSIQKVHIVLAACNLVWEIMKSNQHGKNASNPESRISMSREDSNCSTWFPSGSLFGLIGLIWNISKFQDCETAPKPAKTSQKDDFGPTFLVFQVISRCLWSCLILWAVTKFSTLLQNLTVIICMWIWCGPSWEAAGLRLLHKCRDALGIIFRGSTGAYNARGAGLRIVSVKQQLKTHQSTPDNVTLANVHLPLWLFLAGWHKAYF